MADIEADTAADKIEEIEAVTTEEETAEAQAETDLVPDIVFEDGAAPAQGDDNATIREMRAELRRLSTENRELRQSSAPQRIEVGEKPTLASCDYDEEAFEAALDGWKARKAQAEKLETSAQEQGRQVREQFAQDEQRYRDNRTKLSFADVEEVEQVALAKLDQIQQATIVSTAKDAAKVLYALGRHPAKLAELSQIQNPLKLAYAVAEFERSFSIMPRRQVTEPEEVANGSASMAIKTDKELERLEKEAERTGDRTKVAAYRRTLKSKAA